MKCPTCGNYGYDRPFPICAYCNYSFPPPPWTVTFKGGALGGETHTYKDLLPTIRVPVMAAQPQVVSYAALAGPVNPNYVEDMYRLDYQDKAKRTAIYRYVRPNLEEDNYRLKKENASLKIQAEKGKELTAALEVLRDYLS